MWTPRTLCPSTQAPLRRIDSLLVAKGGSDALLYWEPMPGAAGGYAIHRVRMASQIPDTARMTPAMTVPATVPTFPVVDTGAIDLPWAIYYQALAIGEDGRIGNP